MRTDANIDETEAHGSTEGVPLCMIDRVARGLRYVMYGVPPDRQMDAASPWRVYAKVAISDMREPTDAMRWAGGSELHDNGGGTEDIWRAMIEEALK